MCRAHFFGVAAQMMERVIGALQAQVPCRALPQLSIHSRQELVSGLIVATTPGPQEITDRA